MIALHTKGNTSTWYGDTYTYPSKETPYYYEGHKKLQL